jgi:hypothetical protein
VTGLTYNATISDPGALAVFLTNFPGKSLVESLGTNLSLLTNPNATVDAGPFPPMSCWNPNNTAQNTTLFKSCNAFMPTNFTFTQQSLCIVVVAPGSDLVPTAQKPLDVQVDVDWQPVQGASTNTPSTSGGRVLGGGWFGGLVTAFLLLNT